MKISINLDKFNEYDSQQDLNLLFYDSLSKLIPIGKSGIHIKKKNKGKFTDYCGGEVTDACILKGKSSSNPVIRKRATFADNARHWARKHLDGGLIPGIKNLDISKYYVNPKTYTTQEDSESTSLDYLEEMQNWSPKYKYTYGSSSTTETSETTSETSSRTSIVPEMDIDNTAEDVSIDHVQTSDKMRTALNGLMGVQSTGWGNMDCSDLTSRLQQAYGNTNIHGNSRTIYNTQCDKINQNDVKEGDMIFLHSTWTSRKNPSPDLPSHVATIVDASRINEGIVVVAHGSPGQKTGLKTINLNSSYYRDHLLGFGRAKPQASYLGSIFASASNNPIVLSASTYTKRDSNAPEYTPSARFGGILKYFNGGISKYFTTPKPMNQPDHSEVFEDVDTPSLYEINRRRNNLEETTKTPEVFSRKSVLPDIETLSSQKPSYSGKGYELFKSLFDQYLKTDPEAAKYEKVLTDIAKHESNFDYTILNLSGAPAYGYFQFWQDGNVNNISHYSGLSIEDFLDSPESQIEAAVKMAKSIEKQFNSEDLRIAKAKGYSMDALIRGAWLGGVSGVRKVLRGTGNPNDRKWNKNGKGHSVKEAMNEQK